MQNETIWKSNNFPQRETVAFCVFGAATLGLVFQPKWGALGEVLDKSLCLQQRLMGTHGEEAIAGEGCLRSMSTA